MSSRINFTKAALDQLAPPPAAGSRLTVRDTKVAGLELRVTSNGVKTFSLLRWVPGSSKPERITIGRFPDLSVEQARKMAGTHIAEIASGANPADKRRRARAEMTFADLFDEYLKRHARVHNKTWGKDVEKYKLYLSSRTCGPPLSSMKLSEITRGEIAKLHAKIGTMHPGAANRTLALISSVFGRAIEWDLYDKLNPAKGVRKFPERSRERVLWEDDLPRFFEALEKEPSPDLQDFFLLCLFTGARRGNVQAMRWADINLDRRQWTVSAIDSKNKHEIHIALSEEAVAILNGRKADAGRNVTFVFPGDGRTGRLQDPRKAWERLLNNDEVNQLSTRLEQAGHPFIPDPKSRYRLQ